MNMSNQKKLIKDLKILNSQQYKRKYISDDEVLDLSESNNEEKNQKDHSPLKTKLVIGPIYIQTPGQKDNFTNTSHDSGVSNFDSKQIYKRRYKRGKKHKNLEEDIHKSRNNELLQNSLEDYSKQHSYIMNIDEKYENTNSRNLINYYTHNSSGLQRRIQYNPRALKSVELDFDDNYPKTGGKVRPKSELEVHSGFRPLNSSNLIKNRANFFKLYYYWRNHKKQDKSTSAMTDNPKKSKENLQTIKLTQKYKKKFKDPKYPDRYHKNVINSQQIKEIISETNLKRTNKINSEKVPPPIIKILSESIESKCETINLGESSEENEKLESIEADGSEIKREVKKICVKCEDILNYSNLENNLNINDYSFRDENPTPYQPPDQVLPETNGENKLSLNKKSKFSGVLPSVMNHTNSHFIQQNKSLEREQKPISLQKLNLSLDLKNVQFRLKKEDISNTFYPPPRSNLMEKSFAELPIKNISNKIPSRNKELEQARSEYMGGNSRYNLYHSRQKVSNSNILQTNKHYSGGRTSHSETRKTLQNRTLSKLRFLKLFRQSKLITKNTIFQIIPFDPLEKLFTNSLIKRKMTSLDVE